MRAISEKTSKILGVKTYVLEDAARVVVTRADFQEAYGQHRRAGGGYGGAPGVPRFLTRTGPKSFISADLAARLELPVEFSLPGGGVALGYDTDVVVEVAQAIMDAEAAGALRPEQKATAAAARGIVKAAAKVGLRLALLDEHGMQPKAGASDDMKGAIEGEMEMLRQQLTEERDARTRDKLESATAYGALAQRFGTMEMQMRTLASGALKEAPRTLAWFFDEVNEVATLRRFGTPLTEQATRGKVLEDLGRSLQYMHLPWEEFSFARIDELRKWLFWLHRDARREAKRRGFNGSATWTQPPLPFVGRDDYEDDSDDNGGGE